MNLVSAAVRDLTPLLAGPLFLFWLVVGWSAPFLLLSAVLSLRRIAKAQERLAAAAEGVRPAQPGSILAA
jgi:hypothetical protein